ncbi:ABC-2 type transport system ATP-binding protein [Sediminihabitans luteus]|uniref:ABC-2 type transport system ATP-binding protein n=1 Tax=Sediminihabitans luteus TaxID=1138585 RepID=A0A2M9CD58_9CELL|nr:ATP-binding cassette domain-containing protein [Sediminihabitans luteus]PJJ69266.1 ABC-2 type transport system ATP-binding protein [Sediminihabitans luteus]GII98942.1 daunorubicin resistance protein DrrA family ABC transporter ATP-binding protein [Sediminihabitans luteus]
MNDSPAVEAEGLTHRYGSVGVLDGVDLTLHRGEVLALLGPNGAGKTTTVRILSTLLEPTGGRARVAGFDVVREARRVREVISVTGQSAAVDDKLTGRENLVTMARLAHLPRAEVRARVDELLDAFDLASAAGRRVGTYSGGMRRRLDLAAGLVARPRVLFLDEPSTGLDPRARQDLWDVVRDVVAQGTSLLLTTQYLEEADQLADRVAVLDGGRVVADGTPAALKARVGEAAVELDLATADDAARVGSALGLVPGPGVGEPGATTALRVPTDGTLAHVRDVLDRVDATGVVPRGWSVVSPTLDDVYLALTGHPTEHPTEQEDAA